MHRKAKTALIFKACFKTCLFWRFICKVHENLVSLQCQMKEVETPHFKDKNSLQSKASKLERLALSLEIARINGSKFFL